jgi:transcriptional regulator with XRE-family HTH domain
MRNMNTIVDYDSAIAFRVRAERDARGWSIAELAEKAAISKAMISRVERNEVNPTAALLLKIATAFGLTMASFFTRVEEAKHGLVKKDQQIQWIDPETGYRRWQVLAHPTFPLEITEVEMPPHREVACPASSYVYMRQAVWIKNGSLNIFESNVWNELHEGDCLPFGAPSNVIFANTSDEPCRYIVVITKAGIV